MYWLYYAVGIFWGDLVIHLARSAFGREARTEELTQALIMALAGVGCLWLGMRARLGKLLVPRITPQLVLTGTRLSYLRAVLVGSSLLSIFEPSLYLAGDGGRQIVALSLSFIPLLAFAILLRRYMRGESAELDKLLLVGFLITRFLVGLSSGWLGAAGSIMVIGAVIFIAERRRLPVMAVVLVVLFTLFFQVGKEEFRAVYWTQRVQATQLDRVSFWINASLEKWSEALSDPKGERIDRLFADSVSRVSLLTQTANVIEQTPEVVPYQNGRLYSYLLVSIVPRFIWPDKPSVNEANQFYQVAYGVTAEEDLGKVSISVGVLTESYINFGWYGVIGVMFILGIFFDFFQRTFLSPSSGLLMSSLGIALLPQLLSVEAQMPQYLGGIVQQVVLSVVVLLPIISWGKAKTSTRKVLRLSGSSLAKQRSITGSAPSA